jgi:putative FmdB family regulatory protein
MPVYEYLCQGCDQRFERYVHAWGEPVACPRCAGEAVEKLLSSFALAGTTSSGSTGGGCGCGRGGCGCCR